MLPKKLQHKLNDRQNDNALRQLGQSESLVDFTSNDYLGFAASPVLFKKTHKYLLKNNLGQNGSTGSRLLSGNHELYNVVERHISTFHNTESALIFNSGYSANIGLFSSVPQRHDIILYDEYCHASIRDGIGLSNAKSYKFAHNDLTDLKTHLERILEIQVSDSEIYVITESVFSMDGDTPNLKSLVELCHSYNAHLIIDEAHAVGVYGPNGCGKVQELNIESDLFARIITFGKSLGCHGAAILGSNELRKYLINFSRPFIYTTALTPHSLASTKTAYDELSQEDDDVHVALRNLRHNIKHFNSEISRLHLDTSFIQNDSAIQSCIIQGNEKVKHISEKLKTHGFDVKAILSPTVPKGKERLRFCLHSYNSEEEITKVLELLSTFVSHE